MNRTDVSRAVAGEVPAGKKHERVPRVVVGTGQRVDGQRAGVGRDMTGGFERGEPACGTRLAKLFQVPFKGGQSNVVRTGQMLDVIGCANPINNADVLRLISR